MPDRPHYTAEQMSDALTVGHGLVSYAARLLKCSPQTVRSYITRYPSVAKARFEAREELLDIAELSLYRKILEGEAWAIQFALSTIGKGRGYTKRDEHTSPAGKPVTFTLVLDRPGGNDDGDRDDA